MRGALFGKNWMFFSENVSGIQSSTGFPPTPKGGCFTEACGNDSLYKITICEPSQYNEKAVFSYPLHLIPYTLPLILLQIAAVCFIQRLGEDKDCGGGERAQVKEN